MTLVDDITGTTEEPWDWDRSPGGTGDPTKWLNVTGGRRVQCNMKQIPTGTPSGDWVKECRYRGS